MKIWKIEVIIETTDKYQKKDVLKQIDKDINRGDGIYFDLQTANLVLKSDKKAKED
jgi:hypothetical protein